MQAWLTWLQQFVGPLRAATVRRASLDPRQTPTPAEAALRSIEVGVTQWDTAERLVAANARATTLLGLPADCLQAGLTFRAFIRAVTEDGYLEGQDGDEVYEHALSLIRRRTPVTYDRPACGGGVLRITHRPLDEGGWLTTYQDVTDQRRTQAQLAYMQRHDPLTRLVNRPVFQERLSEALARVGDVAVLVIDLDRFKHVNDTLGSAAGDTLLQLVSGRLNNSFRTSDTIARLGSDDFAVMLVPGSRETAAAAARHVAQALGAPFEIKGRNIAITAAIGVAAAPEDGDDPETLLRHADLALNAAKTEGQDTCRLFDPRMEDRMRARWQIETELRNAIAQQALELFYQPLVDTRDGKVSGLEALMRWRHPQRGLIPPAEFIPVAEATRLIIPIGAWSIRRACEDLMILPPHLRMAVNLSPVQFGSEDLVQTVHDALAETGVSPGRLELEVTETTLMQDPEAAAAILDRLRGLGVRIAMDDFGTGYSSLAYIRNFRFDKVKIDKSFIDDLGQRRGSDAIVQAVAGIASSLGIESVAEGVETEEQYHRVVAAGCDRVQGFLFGHPMPLQALPRALAAIDAGLTSQRRAVQQTTDG